MVPVLPLVGTGFCLCRFPQPILCVVYLRMSSLFTAGTMIGFDASGHIAEETKNARYEIPGFSWDAETQTSSVLLQDAVS